MNNIICKEKLEVIFNFSATIAQEKEFNKLLDLIANLGKELISADRCTIWLIDKKHNLLWTKVAHGLSKITIPINSGIVGSAIENLKPIIINEPYSDERFHKEVDLQSGYTTKSILVIPMFGVNGEIMGAFQAINKLNENSDFEKEDINSLMLASSFGAKILDAEYLVGINEYITEEQRKAHEKQKKIIINDFKDDNNFDINILYLASDILSGDSYSLHKTKNGGALIYILDAMGHGLLPSLTSFAIASSVKQYISKVDSLNELSEKLVPTFQSILSDSEQLSCSFFWISSDLKEVEYFSAGMYPTRVQDNGKIYSIKANNIPIMNFIQNIKISKLKLEKFEKLFMFSDGLVENKTPHLSSKEIDEFLEIENLKELTKEYSEDEDLEDDITYIYFAKK